MTLAFKIARLQERSSVALQSGLNWRPIPYCNLLTHFNFPFLWSPHFQRFPGETLAEFLQARENYLRDMETFGPLFPREPSEAWQIVQGLRRAAAPKQPRQLILPFEESQ